MAALQQFDTDAINNGGQLGQITHTLCWLKELQPKDQEPESEKGIIIGEGDLQYQKTTSFGFQIGFIK